MNGSEGDEKRHFLGVCLTHKGTLPFSVRAARGLSTLVDPSDGLSS